MERFDAWLATAATAGLWICLGWLLVGFALALLAEAPGALGHACGHLAERVSPRIVRRLAQLMTGLVFAVVSVAGAGAATGAAVATEGPGWPGQSTQSGAEAPGIAALSRLPDLDRPTLAAGSPGGTGAPRPSRMPRLPTAMPPSQTVLPRLPTAPAQPSTAGQPGADQLSTDQRSRQRADTKVGSPDEPPSGDRAVVVVPGDTLWGIAARELGGEPSNREIAERWPRWYASNRAVIGADPDLILPGQRLSSPS